MSNRTRGDYFEYQTRDDLERYGWHVARRAGSHGAYDLLAIRPRRPPLFVSCKISGALPARERMTLIDLAAMFDAIPILAQRPRPGIVSYQQLYEGRLYDDWHPVDER